MEAGGFALDLSSYRRIAGVSEASTHYKAIAVLRSFARASQQSLNERKKWRLGKRTGRVRQRWAGQSERQIDCSFVNGNPFNRGLIS